MVLSAAAGVFFRRIHLVGTENIPSEGAVIFAGNHPNSLIDPVLVVASCGRVVHFAAKDKLFAFPLGAVLKSLGCVPIARKMDHGEGKRDNAAAMTALSDVLVAGRCMGIFPEGLSHDAAHLQRLKTGAARTALDTMRNNPGVEVKVIPVGLTYIHRKRVRSRVLVQYGPPISPGPWLDLAADDSRAAASALTAEIEEGIRGLTVNTSDWETLRVLDGVRRLYQPPRIPLRDRVELARRFCEVYEKVRDEPEVQRLYAAVDQHLARVDALGLTDRDLLDGAGGGRAARNLAALLLWLPLALPTTPLHAPLILGVLWAGLRFAPRKDVIGTTRLMVGLGAMILIYAALPIAVALIVGLSAGILALFALPLSGYATMRVLERGTSLRRLWTGAARAFTLRRELEGLRAERADLESAVVGAVARFKPKEMEALYPRESPSVVG